MPVIGTIRISRQTVLVLQALVYDASMWTYGYDLSQQTGLKSGTLYPILIRLCERGWLQARWEEPEPGRPPRHLYRLTAEGAKASRAELARAREQGVLKTALSGGAQ